MYGMKERDVIYLAGLIDGVGSFEVNVSPHSNYSTGFRFEPKIRIGLHESDTAVLGLLDEYCEEVGVKYQVEEREANDSQRVVIQDPDSIYRFVDPFGAYLVRRHEAAVVMLNEILPNVKDGKHKTKQGLYGLMEYVEKLRSNSGRGRDPKYTQEWFAEEWSDEISTE